MKKSASFLKKRSKRHFLCWGMGLGTATAHAPETQGFLPYLLIRVRLEICSRLTPMSDNSRSESPASSAAAARSARQLCNRPSIAEKRLLWVSAPATGVCRVKIKSPNLPSDIAPESWLWLSLVMIRTFDLTNDGLADTTEQHHFTALSSAFAAILGEGRSWGRSAANAYVEAEP